MSKVSMPISHYNDLEQKVATLEARLLTMIDQYEGPKQGKEERPPVNDYVAMLSQANTIRADLEERVSYLERQLLNSRVSVKRNAIRIVERDEKIATLEAELAGLRSVAQCAKDQL
jgi:BMFP domain-containing protein YqiC